MLLGVLVLAIVGFFYFGGETDAPDNTFNPEVPSANEASSGISKFFGNIADAITGWNEGTWRMIAVAVVAGLAWWVFNKVPMVVWLVLAVVGMIVAVQI